MIESIKNERVKEYSKLNDRKYREEKGLFIAEGKHLVTEAVKKGIVKEIFLLNGEDNIYGEVTYVTQDILKKISDLTNPPKVLAFCHKLEPKNITGNVLALDDIKDPGNLGTIIRSAVAFNYDTILISPESVDLYNSKVIRATEGMLFNINIIIDDLFKVLSELKSEQYIIYGTDVNDGIIVPQKNQKKHVLIIGSEAKGISQNLKDLCDENLYIKMNPLCESLNAAVSASILMYELNK